MVRPLLVAVATLVVAVAALALALDLLRRAPEVPAPNKLLAAVEPPASARSELRETACLELTPPAN